MKWIISILTFILTIIFILAGNAIAQTDLNINNTNLFRLGGDVTIAENQVVENAHAIGGSVIIQPKGRVTQTASAIGGNVILKEEARIDGDAYAIGGKVQLAEGATSKAKWVVGHWDNCCFDRSDYIFSSHLNWYSIDSTAKLICEPGIVG
jgi:NDP-sugar pyrophosphorylase family protein